MKISETTVQNAITGTSAALGMHVADTAKLISKIKVRFEWAPLPEPRVILADIETGKAVELNLQKEPS